MQAINENFSWKFFICHEITLSEILQIRKFLFMAIYITLPFTGIIHKITGILSPYYNLKRME